MNYQRMNAKLFSFNFKFIYLRIRRDAHLPHAGTAGKDLNRLAAETLGDIKGAGEAFL